jgi:hypothetical protein
VRLRLHDRRPAFEPEGNAIYVLVWGLFQREEPRKGEGGFIFLLVSERIRFCLVVAQELTVEF